MATLATGPRSELWTRLLVGLALGALAFLCTQSGGLAFTLLVTAGVLLLFAEWAVMHRIGRGWRLALLAVLALACSVTYLGSSEFGLGIILGVGLLFWAGYRSHFVALRGTRGAGAGLLYAGLPAVALLWLRSQPHGEGWVLWLMAIVIATDTCAYFAGRSIGGPRLAPRLSPKKTWAGLVGGAAGASLAAALLSPRLAVSVPQPALAGALLAVLAQAGDLYESWLKRLVNVKDSGSLLPGHGGVMDRVDGLIPVACLVAALVAIR